MPLDQNVQSFRRLGPGRQFGIAAGVAVLVALVLGAAYFFLFRTEYAVLFSDLRPAEAAAIVAELEDKNVDYRLAQNGTTILVASSLVDATRLQVGQQDLPVRGGGVGLELFNTSSIGLTEFAQRINFQRALQGELTRTLMGIDSVESARVHLTLGEPGVFRGDRRPPRASVAITTRPGMQLSPATVSGIQRLVAGSVPELDAASVVVLNEQGAVVSGEPATALAPSDVAVGSAAQDYQARVRQAVERRYAAELIQVSIFSGPATQVALPAEAVTEGAPAATRNYPLRISIRIAAPLTEAERRDVVTLVQDAVGTIPGLADTIDVSQAATTLARAPLPSAAPAAARTAAPTDSAETGSSTLWLALAAGLAALLLLLALTIGRRRAPAGRLSEQQRLRYAQRVRALLSEMQADAAPTL